MSNENKVLRNEYSLSSIQTPKDEKYKRYKEYIRTTDWLKEKKKKTNT